MSELRSKIHSAISDAQFNIAKWVGACWVMRDREFELRKRNYRLLEEATELVQSLGCSVDECHRIVDWVFTKKVGRPGQEAAGTFITLLALCDHNGIDLGHEFEVEYARIWERITILREKDAAKPDFIIDINGGEYGK